MSKKYRVQVEVRVSYFGTITIEADNRDEAREKAKGLVLETDEVDYLDWDNDIDEVFTEWVYT